MDPNRNLFLLDIITLNKQLKQPECFLSSSYMNSFQNILDVILTRLCPNLWISNLKSINEISAIGYALTGDINIGPNNGKEIIVVKGPRLFRHVNNKEFDPIAHEVRVGLALNKLRLNNSNIRVPNFVFTYAPYRCLPPMIGPDKTATWCRSHPSLVMTYSLQENITPNISFKDYCKTCSITNYLKIYTQVLFALNIAYRELDFTHYDLHCNNVLVRLLDNDISLSYTINDKNYDITTSELAVIIDFDYAHIRGKGVNNSDAGISSNKSFPLHDAYRLLTTSLRIMKICNNNNYKYLLSILIFFYNDLNTNQLERCIMEPDWKEYYILPDGEIEHIPISNFISWLLNKYKIEYESIFTNVIEINNNINIINTLPLLDKCDLSYFQASDLYRIDVNTKIILHDKCKQSEALSDIDNKLILADIYYNINPPSNCLNERNISDAIINEFYPKIWNYLYTRIQLLSILSLLEIYIFRLNSISELSSDLKYRKIQFHNINKKRKTIIDRANCEVKKWSKILHNITDTNVKEKYRYLFYTYSKLI